MFAVGADGRPYYSFWDGEWHGWEAMGDAIFEPGTPLTVIGRNQHHMGVFGVGLDGLVHARWFYKEWKDWFVIGGERFAPGTPIAATARDKKHMHIWAVGQDGKVRGIAWAHSWRQWNSLGGPIFPQRGWLAALSRQEKLMELWGIDEKGCAFGRWFDGEWHDWYQLGGESIFLPGAQMASWGTEYGMTVAAHTLDQYLVINRFAVDKNKGDPFWSGWHFVDKDRNQRKLLPSLAMMCRNGRNIDILGIGEYDGTVTGSFLANTDYWVQYQIP